VDTEKLLPGDLLYWWDDPGNWQSVYHTGMYLGNGKMVVAPRTGDVVKISSIWFDNFAGAHRVVDAVKTDPDAEDPTQTPDDDKPTNPSPRPPTTSPDDETSSPDPEPTESESPSQSPSPSPSQTPTQTPSSETPSGGGEDTPDPATADSDSGTLTRDPEE
jgi:hypothetical protein